MNDSVVIFTNTSNNASSYLWSFGDGTTSQEINPVHIYQNGSEFTVTLFAENACGDDTELITLNNIDIQHTHYTNFNLYPNPANDKVTVVTKGLSSNTIELYSITGQIIKTVVTEDYRQTYAISLVDIGTGFYWIKVGNQIGKLIINK